MAATLARGTTVLENVAKEPEVVDLARYLKSMGARISGEGTSVVTIEGVDELHPATHTIIPDRIETGTFAIMAVLTKANLTIKIYLTVA